MKLKYYLRGLGLGVIITALILIIARNLNGAMSDKEIIKRAEALGMVMSTEDSLFDKPDETSSSDETGFSNETNTSDETSSSNETSSSDEETTDNKSENTSTEEDTTDESSTIEEDTTEEVTTEEPSSQASETQPSTKEDESTSANENETTTEIKEEPTTVKTAVINVTKGMRCIEVAQILYKEGIIDDEQTFNQYMRNKGYTHEILVGTYTLNSGMTYDEIADLIVRKF